MRRVRVCDFHHVALSATAPTQGSPPYRGRFAPTPSGPLHLGSLLTALASWLHARSAGGQWLLRIDDLDRERCKPEHAARILLQLEQHGLHWDGAPRYQSSHLNDYEAALDQLLAAARIYACDCTRARLRLLRSVKDDEPIYDGHCRARHLPFAGHALRMHVGAHRTCFEDGIQGPQACHPERDLGDFVLRRRDGVPGYQLACAVDEQAQRITEVVRGADLLGSTFRQLQVIDALAYARPAYRHLPVLLDALGRKLSKQNHAAPLTADTAGSNLWQCLQWLGQSPPTTLQHAPATELIAWGLAHWQMQRLPRTPCIKVEQTP